MAATSVGKIGVKIFASAEGMRKGISDAVGQLDRLERATADIKKSTRNLFALQGIQAAGRAFATIAGAATRVAASVKNQTLEASRLYDSYGKLAQRVGATGQEIAGLVYAGDKAGVSFEQMTLAISTLERRFGDAAAGSQTYLNAFAQLGLGLEDLAGKTSAERFELVADSISKMATPAQQLAVAGKLFEEAGVKLVPLFQGGEKGLKAMVNRAERLGITLKGVDFGSFAKLQDALSDVWAIITSIGARIASHVTPEIERMTKFVADTLTPERAEAFAKVVAKYFSEAAKVLRAAGEYVVDKVAPALDKLANYEKESGAGLISYVSFFRTAFAGLKGLAETAAGAFKGLLGLFLKPFTFAIKKLTELVAFITGDKSGLIGSIGATIDGFADALLENSGKSFSNAYSTFKNELDRLDEIPRNAAKTITESVKDTEVKLNSKGLDEDRRAREAMQAIALRQQDKLTKAVEQATAKTAFYDYNTAGGRSEFHSLARGDEFAKLAREQLEQQRKMVDLLSRPEQQVQLGY